MYPSLKTATLSNNASLCLGSFIKDKVILFSADNLLYSGPHSSKENCLIPKWGIKFFLEFSRVQNY